MIAEWLSGMLASHERGGGMEPCRRPVVRTTAVAGSRIGKDATL